MNKWKVHLVDGEVVDVTWSYHRIDKDSGDYIFDGYPNSNWYPTEIVAKFPARIVKYIERVA